MTLKRQLFRKRTRFIASHTLAGMLVALVAAFFMSVDLDLGLGFIASAVLGAREWGQMGQKLGQLRHSISAQIDVATSLFSTCWLLAQWVLPGVIVFVFFKAAALVALEVARAYLAVIGG